MSLRETFDKAWDEVTARASCVVQEKEELFALVSLMQANDVCSYLELGASEGVSLEVVGRCMAFWAFGRGFCPLVDSVDLGEDHSKDRWHAASHRLSMLEGATGKSGLKESMATRTFTGTTEAVLPRIVEDRMKFGNSPYGAVMIDAGHTYEEAKADWEMYGKLGKMVMFHDIRHPGVKELWQEIKNLYQGVEIHTSRLSVRGGEKMGFGVVYPHD